MDWLHGFMALLIIGLVAFHWWMMHCAFRENEELQEQLERYTGRRESQ